MNQWDGGRPACFSNHPLADGPGAGNENNNYKLTLAEGGAAFLIHHPAGNHYSYLGERFRATVPRILYRLPNNPFLRPVNLHFARPARFLFTNVS